MKPLSTADLLTIPEAAQALALKPKTLRVWLAARRIGYVRLGRAIRIPANEIARLIEEGSVPARAAN